ncbi:MAG: ATP-binding cassette domain-containing protein [Candidatus Bathyarchaeia archaeon]
MNIVSVRNLSKIFNGKVKAVDNISFSVSEGEIFGFLGPNGAGKSTTIHMLTTVLKPTSGTAEICGFDITKNPGAVRRSIGVVPQEYTADEDLTGYENIMLCADFYGIPRNVSKLLSLVELHDAAKRKVETYSGGMRRRLELACGLVSRPKLLFLDEPTLGLDVQTRVAIWNYIRKLKTEYHMTLFMTTHYLEEADAACDKIAIIDHGKILTIGTSSELKAGLGGDVIQIGVKETESDLSSLISEVKYVKSVTRSDSSYRVKATSGEEAAPEIIDLLRNRGYHVTRISLTKPSLDEVYLEYTGRSIREEGAGEDQTTMLIRTMKRARR